MTCTLTEYRLACAEYDELDHMTLTADKMLNGRQDVIPDDLWNQIEDVFNTLVNLRQAAAMRLHDASIALRDAS